MEKVFCSDTWKKIFAENGLKTFEDFYHRIQKKRINSNHRRNVSIFQLKIDGVDKNFFLKRFRHCHLKDTIFAFLNTGKFCTQAAFEWSNIKLLEKNNIGAPHCVCFGEQLRLGFERKSFIITEELKGQCLTDFIAQNWGQMTGEEKENLIKSLGNEIKKIHNSWISLPDLYVWHIFISRENEEYTFSFIDLNRMKRHVTNPNEKMEDLGRLHYSMIDKYFDEPIRRKLIETYAGKEKPEKIEKLVRRVKKYSKKFSARRKTKPNY
ncbi:MAG: hypothetical protein A2Y10_08205 [Planctomycetes bacterium GWF2_41_51]|nr:MAG: hypothetical protein A2Y10_08205 [Planctomycetes bacterium GWF2_41_51]HBG26142.1 hypothetical protein [Phycisphaerales bacterium]